MKELVQDIGAGARAVAVPCLHCGRMVRLADAVIDPLGPAFRAYYHAAPCAFETFGTHGVTIVNPDHGRYRDGERRVETAPAEGR